MPLVRVPNSGFTGVVGTLCASSPLGVLVVIIEIQLGCGSFYWIQAETRFFHFLRGAKQGRGPVG